MFAIVISGGNFVILSSSFGLNGLEFNFSIQLLNKMLETNYSFSWFLLFYFFTKKFHGIVVVDEAYIDFSPEEKIFYLKKPLQKKWLIKMCIKRLFNNFERRFFCKSISVQIGCANFNWISSYF